MVKLAVPLLESATAGELYVPPDKVTVPVGADVLGPATSTLTLTELTIFPVVGADTVTDATAGATSTVKVWLVDA
jgi:hypothetical protein